jgi:GTP cyclohydrolase I
MRRDSYYITLKHQWIGIDISPTACRVMAKRLTVQEILDEHIAKKLA